MTYQAAQCRYSRTFLPFKKLEPPIEKLVPTPLMMHHAGWVTVYAILHTWLPTKEGSDLSGAEHYSMYVLCQPIVITHVPAAFHPHRAL